MFLGLSLYPWYVQKYCHFMSLCHTGIHVHTHRPRSPSFYQTAGCLYRITLHWFQDVSIGVTHSETCITANWLPASNTRLSCAYDWEILNYFLLPSLSLHHSHCQNLMCRMRNEWEVGCKMWMYHKEYNAMLRRTSKAKVIQFGYSHITALSTHFGSI